VKDAVELEEEIKGVVKEDRSNVITAESRDTSRVNVLLSEEESMKVNSLSKILKVRSVLLVWMETSGLDSTTTLPTLNRVM
jgi:hypothetical protein